MTAIMPQDRRREQKRLWAARKRALVVNGPQPEPGVSDALAIDLMQRRDDGYSLDALVAYSGLDRLVIQHVVGGKRRMTAYYRALVAPPWRPLCMTSDELDRTRHEDRRWLPFLESRPCDICTPEFAAENRAAGTCNGTLPGEVAA